MEIQRNINKAREIANHTECNGMACWQCKEYVAIKMAKWKEQQMIEKAVEWLELNIQGGVHPQSTINFIKQFKQAMKGE